MNISPVSLFSPWRLSSLVLSLLIFVMGSSQCGSCDSEFAKKQKLILDMQACIDPYVKGMTISESRVSEVVDIGCFTDPEKAEVQALIASLQTQLTEFPQKYPEGAAYQEREKVMQTAIDAEVVFRTLVNDYQKLVEYLAYCRTNWVISDIDPSPIFGKASQEDQDKLFFQILGDVFGQGSDFEGMNFFGGAFLEHRSHVIVNIARRLEEHTFIQSEEQVRPCVNPSLEPLPKGRMPYRDFPKELMDKLAKQAESAKQLYSVFIGKLDSLTPEQSALGIVGGFRALLIEQLDALQPGESVFLPGRWSQHAVLYQFTKEKGAKPGKPTFTFRIFNAGDGISQYHSMSISGSQIQYFPFVEISTVEQVSVTSMVFLASLHEIANPKRTTSGAQDFYEKMLRSVDHANEPVAYDGELFRNAQDAATCTYASMPLLLTNAVAQATEGTKASSDFVAEQLEFLINLKTLKDYSQWSISEGLDGNKRRNLLKKGAVYFAQRAVRDSDAYAVDQGALGVAANVEEVVTKEILRAERALDAQAKANTVEFIASQVKPEEINHRVDLPTASMIHTGTSTTAGAGSGTKLTFSGKALPLNPQGHVDFVRLKDLLTQLWRESLNANSQEVINSLKSLALVLPMSQGKWTGFDSMQAETIIFHLSRVSELFLHAILKRQGDGRGPADKALETDEYLAALTFLSVADLLNRNFVDADIRLPSMYQKQAGRVLYGDLSTVETGATRWQLQKKILSQYYRNVSAGTHDFFGFDKFPSGAQTERRIYFDPHMASVANSSGRNKHWSLTEQWTDIDWVIEHIKKQPTYPTWLQKEIQHNGGLLATFSKIQDYTFSCAKPHDMLFKGYKPSHKCIFDATVEKRVDEPDVGAQILLRRLAVAVLAGEPMPSPFSPFPNTFYAMRALSVVPNFLLTSNLAARGTRHLDRGKGIQLASSPSWINVSEGVGNRSCVCSGYREEIVHYTEPVQYPSQDCQPNYVEEELPSGRKIMRRLAQDTCVPITVTVDEPRIRIDEHDYPNAPGSMTKQTVARYADLSYSVFGSKDSKPDIFSYAAHERVDLPDPKYFSYANPFLHTKNTGIPFKKFSTDDKDPSKWGGKILPKIFTIGLDKNGFLERNDASEPTRRRVEPNEYILYSQASEGMAQVTREYMQEKFQISSSKDQQITLAWAHFTKFPDFLVRPEEQRDLEKLMKDGHLLYDEFTINKETTTARVLQWDHFSRMHFDLAKLRDDVRGQAFILKLNQLVVDALELARINSKATVPDNTAPLLDSAKELYNQAKLNPQEDEKSFLYSNLAELYVDRESLNDEDVHYLLLATSEHNMFPISDGSYEDQLAEQRVQGVLGKQAGEIRRILLDRPEDPSSTVSGSGREVLRSVLAKVRPDIDAEAKISTWAARASDPIVMLETTINGSKITLDLSQGRLLSDGHAQTIFPINADKFVEVFGEKAKRPTRAQVLSSSTYEWKDEDTHKRVRAQRRPSDWVIQREQAPGEWYQFMNPEDRASLQNSKAEFEGSDYWRALKLGQNGETHLEVYSSDAKELRYTIFVKPDPVTRVEHVSDIQRKADGLWLIEAASDSAYRVFEKVEPWRYVYVWANRKPDGSSSVAQVELIRWGLRFSAINGGGADQLQCGEEEGFILAAKSFVPEFGVPSNYLVCEKLVKPEENKKIVYTPMLELKHGNDKDGVNPEFATTEVSGGKARSVAYVTYEVAPRVTSGAFPIEDERLRYIRVTPRDDAARFYLALRYLWQQGEKYQEAASLIQAKTSEVSKLKSRGAEILRWIRKGNSRDHDPAAIAVRLLAEAWLIKDESYHQGKFSYKVPGDTQRVNTVTELYLEYLQKIDLGNFGILSLRDELFILQRLIDWSVKGQSLPGKYATKRISTRYEAVKALRRDETYFASVSGIDPTGATSIRATSVLDVLGEEKVVPELSDAFSASSPTFPSPSGNKSVLKTEAYFSPKTFRFLYDIASGGDFDHNDAIDMLTGILGPESRTVLESLSDEELRQEFYPLIRMTALKQKSETGLDDPRGWSRLLEAVMLEKKQGRTLRSSQSILSDVDKTITDEGIIADKKQKISELKADVKQLETEIDGILDGPKPSKPTSPPGQTKKARDDADQKHAERLRLYEKFKKQNEEERTALREKIRVINVKKSALESEIAVLENAIKKRKKSIFDYFKGLQDRDLAAFSLVKPKIQNAKIRVGGVKQARVQSSPGGLASMASILEKAAEDDPLKEPLLTAARFSDAFVNNPVACIMESALTPDESKEIQKAAESLNLELAKARTMPADVAKPIQELEAKILAHAEALKKNSRSYSITDEVTFGSMKAEFATKRDEARTSAKALLNEIHQTATDYGDVIEGAYNRLLGYAHITKSRTLDDLIYLLLKRNLVAVDQATGSIHDAKKVEELAQNLVSYMMKLTFAEHADRLFKTATAAQKACGNAAAGSLECKRLLQNMVEEGRKKRNYSPVLHVEYLIFEYYERIVLRDTQVEALDKLAIVEGTATNEKALGGVLEMIMGAGKTSVLLPLLSTLDNKGEWLNIIMLPEALVASVASLLEQKLGSAFGRRIDVIQISRERSLTAADLSLLYERLERARAESRTLITTNSSIQSLFLSFVDRLSRYEKDKKQVSDEIAIFKNIFRFLRQYGRLTIDEVDLALDILQAHQFSVGDSISMANPPPEYRALKVVPATIISFYSAIAKTPALNSTIDFSFVPNVRNGKPLTLSSYKEFKTKMIDHVLTEKTFFGAAGDLSVLWNRFLKKAEHKALLEDYLKKGTFSDRTALFSAASSTESEQDAGHIKDICTILYEELNGVFYLTAGKKLGVHYGHVPVPVAREEEEPEEFQKRMGTYRASRFIAVPYHSGEPMVNSRFGTPLESFNYTIQMSFERREFLDAVESEMDAIKAIAAKGLKGSRHTALLERYKELVGPSYPYSIFQVKDKQIKEIAIDLKRPDRLDGQLRLISRYVLPQVKVYQRQLQTNAQIYEELFHVVQGFTGTLWSADTFPKIFRKLQPTDFSDTAEKTFLIMWQDYLARKTKASTYKPVLGLDRDDLLGDALLERLIEQAYKGWAKPGAIMDEAGIFRAFSNQNVSQAMLDEPANKASQNFKSVIFYDDDNNLKVLSKSGDVNALPVQQVAEAGRQAYWDKKHTTGSDLKMWPDTEAKMAIDHHLTSRSLQQTAWRLRELGKGQSVEQYIAMNEDLEIMKNRLTEEWKLQGISDFNTGTVILYSVVNQEKRLGELRFRALKQKMKNVVVRRVLDRVFAEGTTVEDSAGVYGQVRGLFEVPLDPNSLSSSMGVPKHEQDVADAVEVELNRLMRASYTKAILGSNMGLKLNEEIKKLINEEMPYLPKKVQNSMDDGLEVEVESEQEKELEDEQEKEEQVERIEIDSKYVKHDVLSWSLSNPQRVYQDDFFTPVPGTMLGTDSGSWSASLGTWQPFVSLPDALRYKKNSFLAAAFSPDIFLSFNYAPLHYLNIFSPDDQSRYVYEFFSAFHKYPKTVLVVQDKSSSKLKMIILDSSDVDQWQQFMLGDIGAYSSTPFGSRMVRLALYSIQLSESKTATLLTGAEHLNEASLRASPEFIRLWVQLKFFAGELTYQGDEKLELISFISGPNPDSRAIKEYGKKMFEIFKHGILKTRQETRTRFEGSDIEDAFKSISVSME